MFAADEILQPGIAPGRYLIERRTKHGDRAAAACHGRSVGDRVDAERQPAEYGDAPLHQLGHQPPSPPDTGWGRVA